MASKHLIMHMKRAGFFSNLPGVLYGPAGALLRNNIYCEWWHAIVTSRSNIFPSFSVDTAADIYMRNFKMDLPFDYERMTSHYYGSLSDVKVWQRLRMGWWKKLAVNPHDFNFIIKEGWKEGLVGVIEYTFPEGGNTTIVEEMTINCKKGSNHVLLSMATNIDNAFSAYISDSYSLQLGSSSPSPLPVMRFNLHLAPYKVAVIPKDKKLIKRLGEELRQFHISTAPCRWKHPSYTQELVWQDEIGTPLRIILLGTEKKLITGTVMLYDRDTTLEEEMNGRDVLVTLEKMLRCCN